MRVDFSSLPAREAYGLMTALIMPRPIAWVATLSANGRANLAPFSFFQGITANPPTLMISPVNDRDGREKDTVRNLRAVPEFTVSMVPYALAGPMNATAATLPYEESEFEACGVVPAASERVRPPRVAAAPAAFECAVHSVVRIGDGPLSAHVVFGRILLVHIDDQVLDERGRPDPALLDLVGRLGGEGYVRTTERFNLRRPD